MVSVFFDRAAARQDSLGAELIWGGMGRLRSSVPVQVSSLGRRGMVLEAPAVVGGQGFAWVEMALPGGRTIRPLVEVGQANGGSLPVRFRHVFPDDRRALDSYHGGRANQSGY